MRPSLLARKFIDKNLRNPFFTKQKIHHISSSSSSSITANEPFYGFSRSPDSTPTLSTVQSIPLTAYSATKAFIDPERHFDVATVSELTGHVALLSIYDKMLSDKTGQRILIERPIVSKSAIDIEALEKLNPKTFGYQYASFLKTNGFDPDARAEVKYIQDEELKYVMTRYRQCHDFYHVVTDLPPTIPGELALKYVELFQTGLPVCALSATVGSLKLDDEHRQIWKHAYLPWAIQVGKNGCSWMNVYWEEEFETDLDELRTSLGIIVAPSI